MGNLNALQIQPSEAESLTLGEYFSLIRHNNFRNNPESRPIEVSEDEWSWFDDLPEVIH